MKWQRYAIWAGIALVITAALVAGLRPQPVLVEAATVSEGPLQVTIEEEGRTRVKDRFVVSAPVAGFVRRINLEVGDSVVQKQVLTELEPLRSAVLDPRRRAEAEARVAASRSALLSAEEKRQAAQAEAEYASGEYRRKLRLQKTGSISEDQLSQSHTEMRRAEAQLRSARFAVDVAKYELDAASTLLQYSAAQNSDSVLKERVPILAPVNGAVLSLHRKSEGVVAAGEPLVELGDPRALEVAVDVLSFDAVRLHPGTEVLIERWGGEPLKASVKVVEPVGFTKVSALGVEEQRVWVIVDITSAPEAWQRLGDGYRVEARFILWQNPQVVQVPNASLFRIDDGWGLFVIDEGRAHLRRVEVGERNGLRAQILEGVRVGERVVTHPDNSLEDGVRLTVRH